MLHLNTNLTSNALDRSWKIVIFSLTMFCPSREVAHLTVISVVRQPHLWPNKENLTIMDDDSAVIDDVLMNDRPGRRFGRQRKSSGQGSYPTRRVRYGNSHPDVANNIGSIRGRQDTTKNLPRMHDSIALTSGYVRNGIENLNGCKPSRKWSRHP